MYRKGYWKYWTSLPIVIYDWAKHFFQRGIRGYADRDCWSVDYYLCEIIPEMMRHLKKNVHGYPASLSCSKDSNENFERWKEILEKIAIGFEAAKRINDLENWTPNEGNEMITTPDEENSCLRKVNFTKPWTKEQIEHFKNLDRIDSENFDEGMKLFAEHFFSLWD